MHVPFLAHFFKKKIHLTSFFLWFRVAATHNVWLTSRQPLFHAVARSIIDLAISSGDLSVLKSFSPASKIKWSGSSHSDGFQQTLCSCTWKMLNIHVTNGLQSIRNLYALHPFTCFNILPPSTATDFCLLASVFFNLFSFCSSIFFFSLWELFEIFVVPLSRFCNILSKSTKDVFMGTLTSLSLGVTT